MAFSLTTWLAQLFGTKPAAPTKNITADDITDAINRVYVRELAFWTIVNKISALMAKAEVRTYSGGKEVRDREWYLWNIEPNKNENASTFWAHLLGQLYTTNEVLVVDVGGQLLVADDFSVTEYALMPNRYSSIVCGSLTLDRSYTEDDVIHVKLHHKPMRALLGAMSEDYLRLYSYASDAYQHSRGQHGILHIDAQAQAQDDFDDRLQELMNRHFRHFFKGDNAVLPLFEGYDYKPIDGKTYSSDTSRDVRALADDIYDYTARLLCFPPALAKGDVADTSKALEEALTMCIDPLARLLEAEINRKRNGLSSMRSGTRHRIDTSCIRHVDPLQVSTSIDKLVASGAYSINDVRRLTGDDPLPADWADRHFMTKNYSGLGAEE